MVSWGPATVLTVALTVIGALAGAVVVITNPQTLDFDTYLKTLAAFVVGNGLLGIGRGHAAAASIANTQAPVPQDPSGVKAGGLGVLGS